MKAFARLLETATIRIQTDHGPKVHAFMKELRDTTTPHPWRYHTRMHGNVGVEVFPDAKDRVHLSSITSYAKKGAGEGSKTMKHLTSLADKHGVALHLTPKPFKGGAKGKDLNKGQLTDWYGRHGFVKDTKDKDGFYKDGGGMLRKPQGAQK